MSDAPRDSRKEEENEDVSSDFCAVVGEAGELTGMG